ncbi:hypothetical protein CR513_24986, partial [Mucuna pruriens]
MENWIYYTMFKLMKANMFVWDRHITDINSKLGDTLIAKGKFSLKQYPNNDLKRNEMQKIPHASTMGSLMYVQKSEGLEIIEYFDSDFIGCQDNKRSTFGYIYMLAGGAIS